MPQEPPSTIRLSDEEIEALTRLAAETESLARTGPNAGQPSWRTLIKRIAQGELEVKEK